MPDNTAGASMPVRPLPVTPPEVIPAVLGTWPERPVCRGEGPNIFFPAHADPGARARRVCASFPVQNDCLSYAIAADEWGVWGGMDRDQRRALLEGTDDLIMLPDHKVALSENGERV